MNSRRFLLFCADFCDRGKMFGAMPWGETKTFYQAETRLRYSLGVSQVITVPL
jgi:hypothetical protein